jgi:type IV fimbrial biogenesis protein FimT
MVRPILVPRLRQSGQQLVLGATMVEMLMVMAIAGCVLAMALPSMGAMVGSQKAVSTANLFLASLHFTRGEAIKRNGRAVMCKSADHQQCTTSGSWEQGWVVFHDLNNNARVDAGEAVIQQQIGPSAGLVLRGNGPVASYVSYTPSGSAKLMSGAFQAGTFTLCPGSSGGHADIRKVILGGPGRPRLQKGSSADCS